MKTADECTQADLFLLQAVVADLLSREQHDHARAVARAHAALVGLLFADEIATVENDPAFDEAFRAGERDLAEGRWSSPEDVLERLQRGSHA